MITTLKFPLWKQRDPRWAGQRLGTVNGTTIGDQGCLISVIAMATDAFDPPNPLNPAQVNDLFTAHQGYANGNLVIWNAVQRLLPHVATCGMDITPYTDAPIAKLIGHLNNGGLALIQVGFGGDPNRMHWLLADGYHEGQIIKCDPWYGDETDFTARTTSGHFRYGTGDPAKDILAIHYIGQGVTVAPPPPKPVAKLPTVNPLPYAKTVPNPKVDPPKPTGQTNGPVSVTVGQSVKTGQASGEVAVAVVPPNPVSEFIKELMAWLTAWAIKRRSQ